MSPKHLQVISIIKALLLTEDDVAFSRKFIEETARQSFLLRFIFVLRIRFLIPSNRRSKQSEFMLLKKVIIMWGHIDAVRCCLLFVQLTIWFLPFFDIHVLFYFIFSICRWVLSDEGKITTTKQMSAKVKIRRFVKQRVMNTDIGTL